MKTEVIFLEILSKHLLKHKKSVTVLFLTCLLYTSRTDKGGYAGQQYDRTVDPGCLLVIPRYLR